MEYKSYKNNTIFIDMLFILLLGLILMVNAPAEEKKANVEHKAEYIITVSWPVKYQDDIDTWLEDPIGNVIWYRDKDKGLAHLDRDDLGSVNDTIQMPEGRFVTLPYNEEKTSIRGFIAGEWVLNIHYYSKRSFKDETAHEGVPVDVKIEKLNPINKIVFFETIILREHWDEKTATRFTMLENGDILKWSNLEKTLIRSTSQYDTSGFNNSRSATE